MRVKCAYRDSGRAGVHPALRLSGRHTLHTVHARLRRDIHRQTDHSRRQILLYGQVLAAKKGHRDGRHITQGNTSCRRTSNLSLL